MRPLLLHAGAARRYRRCRGTLSLSRVNDTGSFARLDPAGAACFTGHREIPAAELSALTGLLDRLIDAAVRSGRKDFICGGALGFDTLCAQRVLLAQSRHPGIRLLLALPCEEQTRGWPEAAVREYERIRYAADAVQVLAPHFYTGCMHVRDRFMVDHASLVIAYLTEFTRGGTAYTVRYACEQDLPVLNTAIPAACERFIADNKTPCTRPTHAR